MNEHQKKRFSQALARVAGDEVMLAMLANIAVEDVPTIMKTLDGQVERQVLDEAAKTAHSLKGLLSAFETGDPVDELQPLIDAARQGDETEVLRIHQQVRLKLELLMSEIETIAQAS